MARGIWRYLEKLPPIDWAALAGERNRKFGKGSKHTRETIEKIKTTRRVNARARVKAATQRRRRVQIEARAARLAKGITAKMLLAMQPGHWYGRPDIRDLSGVCRNSVHARLGVLEKAGLVERGANPDHVPVDYVKGLGIDWQARGRSPAVLFRLTEAGEIERTRLAYLE